MTQAVATAPSHAAPSARSETARSRFEALYRECRDDVYAYLAGLLRDRSAAEELTAQAFERAWRRRSQLDPRRGSARAWLFGIARNGALDELRRRKRAAELPADDVLGETTAGQGRDGTGALSGHRGPYGGSEDPAEAAIRRTALRQAMGSLTGRERELVALKFFAGLSNSELAAVIGTSESNAGTKLHRTIEKLRRACDETA